MPVPFDALEEARQRNRLSFRGMQGLDEHSGSTLIAGGEYNGKGSLELYGLSFDRNNPPITPSYKNRVSASSCKLLSVATQGTRVIVSDGNGYMSWFERDATTLIRRYNFMESTFSCQSSAPRFARSLEVARKIIPAGRSWTESSAVNSNEVLYWTGDNIGIVGTCTPEEDSEGAAEIAEQAAELGQERAYGETMHRALESQASEVGWLRGLGLADPYR